MRTPFFVATVALVVLISFFYLTTGSGSKTEETATAVEIARDMARFTDAALDETNGVYNLIFSCSSAQRACAPQHDPSKPPHMGYAVMSLGEVGEKTGDTRLVQKAQTLLDEAVEKCAADALYCQWNFFPLHLYYMKTKDKKYLDAMLRVSDELMRDKLVRSLISSNIPVKWWRLYDATGEEQYHERLRILADEQLAEYPNTRLNDDVLYSTDEGDVHAFDITIPWALYMPAFHITGDARYLEASQALLDAAELDTHVEELWNNVNRTSDLVKATEAMLWIADTGIIGSDEYRTRSKRIIEQLLRERWDMPARPLVNGDYGILLTPTDKATNLQGWLTHLILQMPDERFDISAPDS